MKHVLLILFVVVLVCGAFLAGLFLPKLTGQAAAPVQAPADVPEPEPVQTVPVVAAKPAFVFADAPQLRIVGGVVEWFDGAAWQAYDDADTLLAADPVAAAVLARLTALQAAAPAEEAPTAPHQRAVGSVRRAGGGGGGNSGGGSSGGGGGGSDGQDIEWSGDQL